MQKDCYGATRKNQEMAPGEANHLRSEGWKTLTSVAPRLRIHAVGQRVPVAACRRRLFGFPPDS
jgi:hypothetical protein